MGTSRIFPGYFRDAFDSRTRGPTYDPDFGSAASSSEQTVRGWSSTSPKRSGIIPPSADVGIRVTFCDESRDFADFPVLRNGARRQKTREPPGASARFPSGRKVGARPRRHLRLRGDDRKQSRRAGPCRAKVADEIFILEACGQIWWCAGQSCQSCCRAPPPGTGIAQRVPT